MSFLLTGLFFLMGTSNSNAQELARGTANPYISIAQSFNVPAYALGHFDQAEVKAELLETLLALKPLIGHGASQAQELQFAYLNKVYGDVADLSIAVEISLLKRLEEMKDSKFLAGVQNQTKTTSTQQLAGLYNQTITQLQ